MQEKLPDSKLESRDMPHEIDDVTVLHAAVASQPTQADLSCADFIADLSLALSPHSDAPHNDTLLDPPNAATLACVTKTERPRFSTNPKRLIEEAQRIEIWHVPSFESDESAGFKDNGGAHILIFARDTKAGDVIDGCEIAAYPCDFNGRVLSWYRRYIGHDLNFPIAAQKLRCRIINDLATLHLIENL